MLDEPPANPNALFRRPRRDGWNAATPGNPLEAQRAACEALAKIQAGRPMKPPGRKR